MIKSQRKDVEAIILNIFKHPLFAPIRRVVTSCIYGGSCVLYVANLILHYNTFTTTDLILVSIGTGFWGVASIHSLTMNIRLLRQEVLEQKADNTKCLQRSSTHAIFNSLNHIASSSIFFSVDAYRLNQATPSIITRITGTALWFKASVLAFYMAFADTRRREQDPDLEISIAGLKPEVIRLIGDLDILVAGILYTYPVWSQGLPVKNTYHVLWLVASIIESINSIAMLAEAYRENDDAAAVEMPAANNIINPERTLSFSAM